MKPFFLFLVFFVISCNTTDDGDVICTQEAIAGLNVTVRDAATQAYLSDEVTVVATDGSYSETLMLLEGNPPAFIGAYEREGTYVITASAPGYITNTSQPVTVTADQCHVTPQQLEISLQPE